MTLAY